MATTTDSIPTTPAKREPMIAPSDMRVIWLLLVAAFVAILNETTMGIAIPHLNEDLGLPPDLGQWLTSAFMLTMAVVIPTTGFILQRFTTRQVFIAAMSAFTLGTLVCLVAPGFSVLLAGRVIQAAGTGVMMPLLMTTMMNVVPPQSRGRMMGRVGLVISLAPAIGPTLAGAVLETLSWRWLFGIVLPIAIVALAMGAKWMTNLGETKKVPLDVLSIPLAAFGFGGIVYGLSQFGGHGAGAATTGIVALVVGAIALALFVWRQLMLQRIDDALLDLRVFRSRNFTIAVIIMAIVALSMFGTLTLLPQYLQNVAGLDALQAGLILLPGSVLMGLLGPIMGRIYDARGTRTLLVPGTIMISGALFFYATVGQNTPWWMLVIVQTVMSVGLAMSFTPLFTASLGSLERRFYSHGSAVLNTLQQVAGAAGVAVMTVVYSSILYAGEADGLSTAAAGAPGARTAFLLAAIISLVAVALAGFVRKPADDAGDGFHGGH
ncbi:DHA2 family efflux MFS transporter permease subunit [Microbacterium sp. NPDC056234]|uniref:DHA2 family efflux MFS transporter permease subunit n=1 Tax=Microbacterium sp. NPDC056234 TaxID=3345757 RepID=UPI0035E1B6D2